jgi:hypothetical protein
VFLCDINCLFCILIDARDCCTSDYDFLLCSQVVLEQQICSRGHYSLYLGASSPTLAICCFGYKRWQSTDLPTADFPLPRNTDHPLSDSDKGIRLVLNSLMSGMGKCCFPSFLVIGEKPVVEDLCGFLMRFGSSIYWPYLILLTRWFSVPLHRRCGMYHRVHPMWGNEG